MAAEKTFPKRKITPEQKKTWRNSIAYLMGVAKAQAREQIRLEKALKSPHSTEEQRVKANDRLIALEKEISANKKRIAEAQK